MPFAFGSGDYVHSCGDISNIHRISKLDFKKNILCVSVCQRERERESETGRERRRERGSEEENLYRHFYLFSEIYFSLLILGCEITVIIFKFNLSI